MKLIFEILTGITFVIAMIVGPIAWFRIVLAKTRTAYWKNIALFTVPILLVFVFATNAGLMPVVTMPPPAPPSIENYFDQISTTQKALLIVAGVIWIGGGNLLFYFHKRRLGQKWWQGLNPLDPPFKDFNTQEWLILLGLVILSLSIGAAAINVTQPL